MLRSDDDEQLVSRHRRAGAVRVLGGAFDEAQLGRAALDGSRDLRRVANREADLDLGIGASEGDEIPGKPIAGDGLACLYGERAPLEAAEFAQRQFGGLGPRQHGPRFRQKSLSCLGQLDVPPDPVEQLGVVPFLQGRNRVARGRLREVQGASGLGDMLSFGDRDEDAELFEGHFRAPSDAPRSAW